MLYLNKLYFNVFEHIVCDNINIPAKVNFFT